jgi:hypothetical protein
MCDYSLENVASRPAVIGEKLVSTSFSNTITKGFAGSDDRNVAVCVLPGTELAFETAPRYAHPVTHWEKTAPGTVARFRQINPHIARTHHDALEFADGTIVPLARLAEGQSVTILQLPSVPLNASEHELTGGPDRALAEIVG